MKKIMILGAGLYQVPLIKKAKEIGLYTIVVSIPGNYPGFELADRVYYDDTTDYEKILEIASKENIDGIVTTGTDVAVLTIGKVCDKLGLKGVSETGASIACDKLLMKKAYQKNDVNTAEYYYANVMGEKKDFLELANKIGYPVIFKAVDSSGSRGVSVIKQENEIDSAIMKIKEITRHDKFIIEKYLEGTEFGAQAFVQDGKIEFILPHGDYVFEGDAGVPIGHYVPFDIRGVDNQVKTQIEKAIYAMKLDNCAINADFILCDGKVYVLEIGARCGATQLPELVSIYYGYNYYEKIIRVSLGEKVSFDPENKIREPNASHLLLSDKSGKIVKINSVIEKDVSNIKIEFDYNEGEYIRRFRVGPDRIGHVITKGNSLEDAQKLLFKTLTQISVIVE